MAKTKKISTIINKMGTLFALLILGVILSAVTPNFLKITNIMNILKQTAVNALIASGMLVCLITAGIDLSVGANAITCACIMGMLLEFAGIHNPVILILAALGTGTFVGWSNGMLLTKLHLPHPFVSTLGMKNILCGIALLVAKTKMISGFPSEVTWLGSFSVFTTNQFPGIPMAFIAVILFFCIFHIFLSKTTLGRSIYCVGGNVEAARLSGINSDAVLIFCYSLSGFMCGLAGIVLVGRTGIANPAAAIQPYETDAIAACIIGGASFMGGKGTIWGTLVGALLIAVIRNGLTLLNAQSDIQYIVIGSVIILVVLIDITRERMAAKTQRMMAIHNTGAIL
jgi:ribose transport system permease protein